MSPFIKSSVHASMVWLIVVGLSLALFDPRHTEAAKWFLIIAILILTDFFLIAKVSSILLSDTVNNIKAVQWVIAKFACLGLIVLAIWHGRTQSPTALSLGVGSLFVVPFLGGILSQKLIVSDPNKKH